MVAIDQANVLDLGTHLDDARGAFQFQVLDHDDRIAVLQQIASRVTVDLGALVSRLGGSLHWPFMGTLGANVQAAVLVGKFGIASWAGW